jgi:hypothetical protein
MKEKDHFEDLGTDGRIILKNIKDVIRDVDRIYVMHETN